MASGLRAELKQRKPFATTEEVVFLNALRTADHLLRGEVCVPVADFLRVLDPKKVRPPGVD